MIDLITFLRDKQKKDITMSKDMSMGVDKAIKWIIEYENRRKTTN